MNQVFGKEYASSYDFLYGDKNYDAECDVIEQIIREYGPKPTHNILDLGCGTGNHALPLLKRGYAITGVDRSEEMLALTRLKSGYIESLDLVLYSGDIRTVRLEGRFDAALMMFAVLGYQLENKDVLATLKTARKHLKPGGVLIFDIWYGPAVLRIRPSERSKVIPTPEGQMVRFANGSLDIEQQICTVQYQIWQIKGDHVVSRSNEKHDMRYFFPRELDFLLDATGFIRLRSGAFPDFDKDASENTWSALVVARAV